MATEGLRPCDALGAGSSAGSSSSSTGPGDALVASTGSGTVSSGLSSAVSGTVDVSASVGASVFSSFFFELPAFFAFCFFNASYYGCKVSYKLAIHGRPSCKLVVACAAGFGSLLTLLLSSQGTRRITYALLGRSDLLCLFFVFVGHLCAGMICT
jgi:hypothetical protein